MIHAQKVAMVHTKNNFHGQNTRIAMVKNTKIAMIYKLKLASRITKNCHDP